jgi:crotonobetainyl-CoA:carnitine CoA-transferase CaiB-like acyl-CoA transferase
MGGIMSLTGEPEGDPIKVGVGIADIMCGMYASTAILAALHHRHATGKGQHIDLALLDTQVAWLTYEALNYLTSGAVPKRQGNEHPNIVPYKVLPASDGFVIFAIGNDGQFQRFCDFAGAPDLAADPRFATNTARLHNRQALYEILPALTVKKTQQDWLDGLAERKVPAGPVNNLKQVFEDPQILHRDMRIEMAYPGSETGKTALVGNPIRFSETPVSYHRPPPQMGQQTDEVLARLLNLDAETLAALRERGII